MTRTSSYPAARACTAAAAAAYLVIALWTVRDVLPAPDTLLPMVPSSRRTARLYELDQQMVVSVVTRNARLLPTRPWGLADEGQCFPTPRAYTLGEHMFGNGLLMALPYSITHDPIASYNVLLILTLWIPALTMYALSLYFTGSPAAAFVAGLVHAFAPERLGDPVHLYTHRDLWTPLALLFLHRLFATGTWRSAIGLAVFFALGIGESLYTLLSSAILVASLGVFLCFRYARRLPELAGKLAFCAAVIAGVAWLVLGPYLDTAAAWSVLRTERSLFALPAQFLPGQKYFPGVVGLALAAVALVDRLRGPRAARGYDPRLVFLVAGLLVAWSSTRGVWLPWTDIRLPSPIALARKLVPGLDAVRVLALVSLGQFLAVSFLAGYGVLALVERLRGGWRVAVTSAVSAAFLLEVLSPPLATWSFGRATETEARRMRPADEEIALVERTAEGAVLDLPRLGALGRPDLADQLDSSAHYLLLSAYHGRPTAACYNSFRTAAQDRMTVLAAAVPDARALEELSALGFRTIFVHRRFLPAESAELPSRLAAAAAEPGARLVPLGSAGEIEAYRIAPPRALHSDFGSLAPAGSAASSAAVSPPTAPLAFAIENRADATFVHPEPRLPSDLVLRWTDSAGETIAEENARALLPLALAPGAASVVSVEAAVPAASGSYDVALVRATAPDEVLARLRVTVPPQPAGAR